MATGDQFEYVDEESVDPDLICIICSRPLLNPVCTPCDHTFCSGCISKWINTNTGSCVTCALTLSLDDVKPASRTVRNMLDRLRVTCLLCGQTGLERGGFPDHLKQTCPDTDVECVAADVKCEWTGKRNQLNDHLAKCAFYSCRSVITSIIDENKQLKEQVELQTTQISQLQTEEQRQRTENTRLLQQRTKDQAEIRQLIQIVNKFMPSTKSGLRAQVVQCKPREKLDLSEQQVTDEDVPFIAMEAIVRKGCGDLCLASNEITQEGVSYLANALQYNSALKALSLSSNKIGDRGALLLSNALGTNMPHLEELDLSAIGITDEGIQHLAKMLQENTRLTHLWLDSNHIGNPGIKRLTDTLTGRTKLSVKNLSLTGNKSVSDTSIQDLIRMISRGGLTTLHLRYCNISEAGKQQLRQTLTSYDSSLILFI